MENLTKGDYMNTQKPESVNVLQECIDLQLKKSQDYQNPNSTIVQPDYYPSGIFTIYEIMHAKMLRTKSVMEAMMHDPNYGQNFESIEDSVKDLINYASFFVSYSRGKMKGQNPDRDAFNKIKKVKSTEWSDEQSKPRHNRDEVKRPVQVFDLRDPDTGSILKNVPGAGE